MKPKSFPRFAASHTACVAACAIALTIPAAFAATATKAATGTDLTLAASWSGGSGPGFPTSADTATWASTSLGAGLTLGSAGSWGGISATGALSDIVITGAGTLTLAGGGIDMSSSTVNLSLANPISLGASQTWNVGAGRTLTASGTVGGTAGLIKAGTGNLVLTGVKSYSGGTTINDGTLKVDMTSSTGGQTLGAVTITSGVYELLNTNTTVDGTLVSNSTFSGAGTLRKSGAGYLGLTFTGSNINSFNGTLDVVAGTLGFNNGIQGSGNAALQIASGALVDVRTGTLKVDALNGVTGSTVYVSHTAGGTLSIGNNNGSGNFAGSLAAGSSALTLIKNGTGTQTLSGTNNHTGTTTVNNGTLKLANPATWTSPIALATTNSPILELSALLASDAWNLTKQVSGANASATVNKTGAGTVGITTSQTYTGATQALEGKLLLGPASPSSIPGMKVWLDAADPEGDGNTTTPTNGSGVAVWKNKGTLGASGDFTPTGSGANNPVFSSSSAAFNNQPVVTFNAATGKQLVNATNFTNTVSVVYVGRIGTTRQRLVSGNSVNWILGYWNGNMNVNYWNGGSLGSAADSNAHIWINGATAGANPNGYRFDAGGETLLGAGGSTGPTAGLMLGGGWSGGEKSDGDIAELMVFDHQLTTAERQQIESYLYNKYFTTSLGSLNTASPVSVSSGATFGGYGSAGNITVASGGKLEGGNAGNGTLTASSLTTSGTAVLTGTVSSTAGYKPISLTDFTVNGGNQSVFIGAVSSAGLTNGSTYDFLTWSGTSNVTDAGFLKQFSRSMTPVLDLANKKIQVTYNSAAPSIYWTGDTTAWDLGSSNWKQSSDNGVTQFLLNDTVLFNDLAVASSTVDISAGDVPPSSTTFNNATTAYTLQGTNGISTGSITKTGAATVTINNANTYPGTTTVSGGTLKLGNPLALGATTAGTIVGAGGVLDLNGQTISSEGLTLNGTGISSGGALVNSSGTTAIFGGAVTAASSTSISTTGNITLSGSLVGNVAVNKIGPGTLTLNGTGFWSTTATTAQYNVTAGALTMDASAVPSVANILAGGWNVSSGATFNLNYNTASSTLLLKTGVLSGAGTVNLTGVGCVDFWSSGTTSSLAGFSGQINIGCSSLSIQTDTLANATTTASVDIAPGKFLDLRTQGFVCDKLTGTGIVADSHSLGGIETLTVGAANGSSQFDGVIKNSDAAMIGYAAGGVLAFAKTGTGTFTLTGANSYTGGTTISGGVLQIGSGTANGTVNGNYSIAGGTSLYLNFATAAAPTWSSLSGAGTVRLNSAQAVNGSANWGSLSLGAGFTGTLQLDKGRVDTAPAGLGGATNVLVANGAQFLAYNNTTNSLTFNQNFSLNGMGWGESGQNFGALRVSVMNATFAGSINLTGDTGLYLQNHAGGVMTVSGNITGANALSLYNDRGNATDAITLTGAKTFTGATLIAKGLVSVDTLANGNVNSSIGASSNAASNLVLSSTADSTLRYTGATTSTDRNITLTDGRTSTIDVSDAATSLTITGGSSNTTGALTKSGSGTLILNGSNSHTGITTVSGGTLGVTGSLSGALTVNASGTIAPGTTGTGTLASGAATISGTYACQFDGANSDMLAVTGNLNLTGATLAVSSVNNAPSATSYLIATYTGALTGAPTVTGLPGYVVDTSTPGQVRLVGNPAYSSWAASMGLTGANGGKTQDPDGDSSNNLMEFAFGTDPLTPSSGVLTYSGGTLTSHGQPTTSITNLPNGVDYRAVFCRRKDYLSAGLTYSVQFSVDFTTWVNSTDTPTVVASDAEFDAVSVPYPLFIPTVNGVEKPTFFRVAVTSNP